MAQYLTKAEQETVITFASDQRTASVTTSMKRMVTKLEKNPAAKKVDGGMIGKTPWGEYEVPVNLITIRKGTTAGQANRTCSKCGKGFASWSGWNRHEKLCEVVVGGEGYEDGSDPRDDPEPSSTKKPTVKKRALKKPVTK